jgi:septum site-determining protein MinC
MLNNKICDFKTENTSITVLSLNSIDLSEISMFLRQQKKMATGFFEACPIVVDFDKIETYDFYFVQDLFKTIKEIGMKPVGVKNIKEILRGDLLENKIPVFVTSQVNNTSQKIEKETVKEIDKENNDFNIEVKKEVIKIGSLNRTINESIRGGQQIVSNNQNLNIIGSVNEGAEVVSYGSIFINGNLSGKALAGTNTNGESDQNAIIICNRFNPTLVSIAGIYRIFEDGVPENIKNKSVLIRLSEEKLVFELIK